MLVSLLLAGGVLAASTPRLLGQALLVALLATLVLLVMLLALLVAPSLLMAAALLALVAHELSLRIPLL